MHFHPQVYVTSFHIDFLFSFNVFYSYTCINFSYFIGDGRQEKQERTQVRQKLQVSLLSINIVD